MDDKANETPAPLPSLQLSADQNLALEKIAKFLDAPALNEFRLGGYAGTGKTTVIKILRSTFTSVRFAVVSFTGKAVDVLRRKGVSAKTIHSLIYNFSIDNGKPVFSLKEDLPYEVDVIVVDESSMISTQLYEDLKSFGIKLIFVGDPGQLEPIGNNPNLMKECDYVLEHIHRQAEQSPIIQYAQDIRLGKPIGLYKDTELSQLEITNERIVADELKTFEQVICAKNITRKFYNKTIRSRLGRKQPGIEEGEKLICLFNNVRLGVFNGMILFVDKIKSENEWRWIVNAKDEVGNPKEGLPIWKYPYFNETYDAFKVPSEYALTDYGYVITCHKSQGSEWNSVFVIDEPLPKTDMRRWRYTAITRASKKLTYKL